MDNRTKIFFRSMIVWLGISLAMSIAIYYGLAFVLTPFNIDSLTFQMIDIMVIMGVFIAFTFYMYKNPNTMSKFFMSNDQFDMSKSGFSSTSKAHCMSCGKVLGKNERQCSRCGSRQARYY